MLGVKIQRYDVKPGSRGIFGKDVIDLLNCFPAIGAEVSAVLVNSPAVRAEIVIIMVNLPNAGKKAQGSEIVIQGGKK